MKKEIDFDFVKLEPETSLMVKEEMEKYNDMKQELDEMKPDLGGAIQKEDLLNRYLKLHTESFQCREGNCDKTFRRKQNLALHIEIVHLKLKPHSCTHCGKSFGLATSLRAHIATIHEGDKPHACPMEGCSFATAIKGTLTKHLKTHTDSFQCTEEGCDRSFNRISNLTIHIQTVHLKLKPYSCTVCGKDFGHSPSLQRHMAAVHQEEKPHACPMEGCNYATAIKGSLTTHIKTHSDNVRLPERIFHCKEEGCDRSFRHQSRLDVHIETVHLKLKPHACFVCSKAFGLARNLRVHMDTVHQGERRHVCPMEGCSYAAGSKNNLCQHILRRHSQPVKQDSSVKLPDLSSAQKDSTGTIDNTFPTQSQDTN